MTLRALPIRSPDAKPSRSPQRGPPGDVNTRELVPVGAAFSVPFLAGQKGDTLDPSQCDGCTERISGPIRAATGWTVRVKVRIPTHIEGRDDPSRHAPIEAPSEGLHRPRIHSAPAYPAPTCPATMCLAAMYLAAMYLAAMYLAAMYLAAIRAAVVRFTGRSVVSVDGRGPITGESPRRAQEQRIA